MLKNISIKVRLISILLILIVTIIALSINLSFNKYIEYKEATFLKNGVFLSVKISTLVHEIQKERGMSSGFVGSSGKKFGDELKAQRIESDKKKEDLEQFLATFKFDTTVYPKTLFDAISRALSELNNLKEIREKITSLSISAQDVLNYYTNLNNNFLETISSISKISSNNDLTKSLISYSNFLLSKERSGVERAVLTNTFAKDSFADGMFIKFIKLITEQDSYINSFNISSSDKNKEFLQMKLENNIVAEVNKMREIAISKYDKGEFGVEAGYFFTTITQKINLLKEVEDELSKNLLLEIEEIILTAEYKMSLFISINFIVVLLSIIFSYILISDITRELNDLKDRATNLANGDGDLTKRLLVNSNEIGKASAEINKFIEKIHLTIGSSKDTSYESASIANELYATSIQIGNRVENEAQIIDVIVKSSKEMEELLRDSIIEAEETKKDIINASENLEDARSKILDMVAKINKSSQIEEELARKLNQLSTDAEAVKNVLTVINDIADQTNLLALNAAIEAARAGEHGRGFAVVADEVRQLAERTQKSLSEINATINVIVQAIVDASEQMNINSKAISELSSVSNEVEHKINDTSTIMQNSAKVADKSLIDTIKISNSVKDKIQEVEEVNELSSSNARSVEEMVVTIEHLHKTTEELSKKLNEFKTQ